MELSSSGIFLGSENVLYARGNRVTHNILEFLKKIGWKPLVLGALNGLKEKIASLTSKLEIS